MTPLVQAPFRLLDLPPELRERIYSHLVVYPSNITQSSYPDLYTHRLIKHTNSSNNQVFYSGPANPSRFNLPPVTRVNTLLRRESLAVFFGKNRFHLSEAMTSGWLFQLDDDIIAHMRKIQLDYSFDHHPISAIEHPAPPPSPSSPSPPALREIICNITLQRSKPYCKLEFRCVPRNARLDESTQLETRMNELLRRTLAGPDERGFDVVSLMQLWEHWVLWCNSLLVVQTKADAAQNIAKATRHAMEMRLRLREGAMKMKKQRITRKIDGSRGP